ncbi:protein adenylyltransferase SelO [Actinoplanes friuliensis]|uniref:Protein nucleotidyltransferase YdiU n=1 Tax=Actinoplanes friuliensis DSM 7358 TaxID=1246995 RepID=U5W7I7_9ACTN|nr:YdiU family protein [Actinoplanes friuliensis]AGZ43916.1 hypothetical protein AFR_28275 [Actinoplanes friuliensis DSM 7358]
MILGNRFARELPELALTWQADPAPAPQILVLNEPLALELGLDPADLSSGLLAGTDVPQGATPVAQAYAGHQFGGYSPRLGDGRALLLGELTTPDGSLRDLHLKGSGRTPFARGGDGLAAVGPMLREYVISQAMHALGIPTTRSLAVVSTGRTVQRDTPLPGAVLTRVAASHLRVGTFQYARATGNLDLLRRLADHAITRHHPAAADAERPYLALFESVLAAQASLIARWMLAGFIHGVMNTDNMTISGETIDYGPCAFLDTYDPATVFSSIDTGGRYAYGNQPAIAQWNLARLAESLLPLIDDNEEQAVTLAVAALETFGHRYRDAYLTGLRAKLGVPEGPETDALINELLPLLKQNSVDYTSFFRALSAAARGTTEPARTLLSGPDTLSAPSLLAGRDRLAANSPLTEREDSEPSTTEPGSNAPGNARQGDAQPSGTAPASTGPGGTRPGDTQPSGTAPASTALGDEQAGVAADGGWLDRWLALKPDAEAMDRVNPVYIPRNHLVEEALTAASDDGDLKPLEQLLEAVTDPFQERPGLERYAAPAPKDFGPYQTFCGT